MSKPSPRAMRTPTQVERRRPATSRRKGRPAAPSTTCRSRSSPFNKDGSEKVFAGCYTARLVNPAIQEPPFRPLQIEKGSLKPSDVSYDEAVPEACPDAPAPEVPTRCSRQAKTAFAATHTELRPAPARRRPEPASSADKLHDPLPLHVRYRGTARAAGQAVPLLSASTGAYNESHIYYLYDEDDGAARTAVRRRRNSTSATKTTIPKARSRASPSSAIGPTEMLANSSYDEATKSISSHAKWRGVGDASSAGTWIFRDGDFTLVRYDVDASYDGEINPETVLDSRPRRESLTRPNSIQLSVSRQSVMRIGVPWVPVSKRTKRAG